MTARRYYVTTRQTTHIARLVDEETGPPPLHEMRG
jgi:hypothetical protein